MPPVILARRIAGLKGGRGPFRGLDASLRALTKSLILQLHLVKPALHRETDSPG